MTPHTHIEPVDHSTELLDAVECLLERELHSYNVTYIWPEQHRILFRTDDDQTGSVNLLVNWDVPVTQKGAGTHKPSANRNATL